MEDKKCSLLHELMNNLAIVLGECELLESERGEKCPRLEVIRERANHMAELVRHYDCPADYEPPRDGFIKSVFRAARSRAAQ